MDVGGWLRSLGLEQYEAAFRENEIDERVLPSLTAEDLKELGVAALGHRRLLLDAIAALRTDAGVTGPSAAAGARSTTPSVPPEDRAERRQVTVMFCDLVGSTALAASMDPEDLREVISAYQKCAAETIRRFDGFVAKYMGDGVLVYFGYPQAHEDDAERAVRAGLELISALAGLTTRACLQTRVGIATGLVVVGDLIGSGASQEQAIVGETPNLAARLQGVAEPNSVVIAESTRKLLGDLFELEDLGAQDLRGIAGPVGAWAALRSSSVESRFDALHASGLTELVGREEELELLLRRWSKAKTGEGQVVLLSGEPGIGKSRLTAALLEPLAEEPHTRLRYFCSPQHIDSAFYPIISQIERAARFTYTDSGQVKLDKLDAVLALSSASKEDAALFADMLSLPNDGRYPLLELTPQLRRQRTLEALFTQVATLAGKSAVLTIFEDAHWSDPTSLEAFGRAVDRIATLPVLLLITFRPEFNPPWVGQPHVTSLTLNRLTRGEVEGLIYRVAGNKLLPANIRQDIIERTDGIPLFVEEMTKAVVEAESQRGAERAAAAIPSAAVTVPATLHASLMARLDRLGSAKEVAQIGAVIGRDFSHALLAAVARKPEAQIQSALDRLIAAGLLFKQGLPPQATYLFKHVLVQDAAYGTLLREPRRALHARIAETLESQFAEIAQNRPELLAQGLMENAANLWGKAGQRSLDRSALAEAIEQFTRALDAIATLPSSSALRREQIRLQIALIPPLTHAKGHAAPETKAAIERARLLIEKAEAIGEPPEDPLLLFVVLLGFWVSRFAAFDGTAMCELAGQFLAIAERQRAAAPQAIGHRIMGVSRLCTGDPAGGCTHFSRAVALYNPVRDRPLAIRFASDNRVASLTFRSVALWLLGFPDAAREDIAKALEDARDTRHAGSLMTALGWAPLVHIQCGDYAVAQTEVEELGALANEKSAAIWKAGAMMCRGYLLSLTGPASEAAFVVTSAIDAWQSTGATLLLPLHLGYLSKAQAEMRQFENARHSISRALLVIEKTDERWFESEVNCRAGDVALLPPPDEAKAEAYFERALAVAREQQAKSLELRAAMSMARLWRDQGKRDEARNQLARVYNWFTEGFDTLDLKEAKALLDDLSH